MDIPVIQIRLDKSKVAGKNIIIPLDSSHGKEVEDDLIFYEKEQLENNINPIVSRETVRFKPKNNTDIFLNVNLSNDYVNSGLFTNNQLLEKSAQVRNSFFILDLFDMNNSSYNNRLFTGFYRINTPNQYSSTDLCARDFTGIDTEIKIRIKSDDVTSYLLVPENFIQTKPKTFYIKLRFFYAKTGKIYNFVVSQITQPSFGDERDVYLPVKLSDDNTYEFLLNNIVMDENSNPNLLDSNPNNNFQKSFNTNNDKEIITETGQYL